MALDEMPDGSFQYSWVCSFCPDTRQLTRNFAAPLT